MLFYEWPIFLWISTFEYVGAHYGDNHKGICLEINEEEFIKENEKTRIFNVETINYEYPRVKEFPSDNPVDSVQLLTNDSYFKEYRNDNKQYLYLTKTKEWEYEQEARLIYFSAKKKDEFCKIKKSLSRVFTGVDFNEIYKDSLIRSIGSNKIPIGKLGYVNEKIEILNYFDK